MKRYIIALICTLGFAVNHANAMDYETARRQAYYLTDKMAYELNLNSAQYDDIYEINLDYFLQLRTAADIDAVYLRYRNEDIRYILYEWQWAAFHTIDYFYRPVSWLSGAWYFPVYRFYSHAHFYYSHPTIYWKYRGGHGRPHMGGRPSYYHNRRPHWNGGMRGKSQHTVAPPDRGGNHRPNTNPGRGDHKPRPEAGGRRPETRPAAGHGTPNRGGNDMRSSSRTTVTNRGGGSRGSSTSTPSRGTGNPTRGQSAGASSSRGGSRNPAGAGSSRGGSRSTGGTSSRGGRR